MRHVLSPSHFSQNIAHPTPMPEQYATGSLSTLAAIPCGRLIHAPSYRPSCKKDFSQGHSSCSLTRYLFFFFLPFRDHWSRKSTHEPFPPILIPTRTPLPLPSPHPITLQNHTPLLLEILSQYIFLFFISSWDHCSSYSTHVPFILNFSPCRLPEPPDIYTLWFHIRRKQSTSHFSHKIPGSTPRSGQIATCSFRLLSC